MTAIRGVTVLTDVPLVACRSDGTALDAGSATTTLARRTLVAVTVVTAIGTGTIVGPSVNAASQSTNLCGVAGASA